MDMETVLPFKTVNDIVKELKEGEELPLAKQCDCGNCSCGGDI